MITVWIRLPVASSVPGRVGRWSLETSRQLPAVPTVGDQVELADGWASHGVRFATFLADGTVRLRLVPIVTDSPDRLDELARLVIKHGWTQLGGPSPGQGLL